MGNESPRSKRFYRTLLKVLPFDFRSDFGPEMEAVFHEQHANAGRREGKIGLARLWWETIVGLFRTAPAEHWSMLRQDAGFALRMMRKNPGFTLAAVLTLGLGIGANSAIFSVVNAVLLRPLPYAHGDRIITVAQQATHEKLYDQPFSVPEIVDYRSQNHSLDALVEYHQMNFILLGRSEPERIDTGVVSWNYFDVFGMQPLFGRSFRFEDEQPGAPAVLLLSYEYWVRSFGGDPTVVGKSFRMNDKIHTVVGVLPPIPQYPNENDVYMPTTACPFRSSQRMITSRTTRMMSVFGRMRPGVRLGQAAADFRDVADNLQKTYPDVYPAPAGYSVATASLRDRLTQSAKPTILMLLGAAAFVLLIACANVANLNLARMVKRERELAIRSALGASRVRMFRQLLTESFLLALLGGTVGLLFASGTLSLLVSFASRFTPRAREIHMDSAVLLFTFLIAVLTSMLSGSAPALAPSESVVSNLKEGSAQSTLSKGRRRVRSFLIVGQVAVSFVLLIGAGLMLRSFLRLIRVDPGFQPENVLTMRIGLNFSKYDSDAKQRAFFDSLTDRIQSQSGVKATAVSMTVPLGDAAAMRMAGDLMLEGQTMGMGQTMPVADFRFVSPSYFDTLHIPLLSSRIFSKADRVDAPVVAVLSQSAAGHLWPNQDSIGKRFSPDNGKTWVQVVGIVGDVHEYGLDQKAPNAIYISLTQQALSDGTLMVKTAGDPMAIASQVIEQIHQIDANQPAARVRSLEQVRAESVAAPRLTTNLLGIFAGLALAIAAAGIGGVMALVVNQRKHEIGVRMAIGARPAAILRMVLGQGLALALIGIALGFAGALGLTRLLRGLLFEIEPTDPVTFAAVAAVLAVAAIAACYIPARRAALTDPIVALRTD